uniref:Uncharacterized protein n=1 Tax=Triticum urartu TaxID=4572 RepID=A0A8R7P888_TRIUA
MSTQQSQSSSHRPQALHRRLSLQSRAVNPKHSASDHPPPLSSLTTILLCRPPLSRPSAQAQPSTKEVLKWHRLLIELLCSCTFSIAA